MRGLETLEEVNKRWVEEMFLNLRYYSYEPLYVHKLVICGREQHKNISNRQEGLFKISASDVFRKFFTPKLVSRP